MKTLQKCPFFKFLVFFLTRRTVTFFQFKILKNVPTNIIDDFKSVFAKFGILNLNNRSQIGTQKHFWKSWIRTLIRL